MACGLGASCADPHLFMDEVLCRIAQRRAKHLLSAVADSADVSPPMPGIIAPAGYLKTKVLSDSHQS